MVDTSKELFQTIAKIYAADRRYRPEAYLFTLAALHFTVAALPQPRHVSGQELVTGIRRYALDQFGPMSRAVFEHWGIRATADFGHIVFSLVEHKILSKTDHDSLEHFRDVYDFSEAFAPTSVAYTLADDLPDLPTPPTVTA
ncbi:MAG: hypothetical protein HY600_07070 [Candidatus Omnitrophica bacterium]|nr:hypothetical protein [Candidatus Omnitrophota bacterium]